MPEQDHQITESSCSSELTLTPEADSHALTILLFHFRNITMSAALKLNSRTQTTTQLNKSYTAKSCTHVS